MPSTRPPRWPVLDQLTESGAEPRSLKTQESVQSSSQRPPSRSNPGIIGGKELEKPDKVLPNPIPILPENPPNSGNQPRERLINHLPGNLGISSGQLSVDVLRSRISLGDHSGVDSLGPLSEPSLGEPFLGQLVGRLDSEDLLVEPLSGNVVAPLESLLSGNDPRILDDFLFDRPTGPSLTGTDPGKPIPKSVQQPGDPSRQLGVGNGTGKGVNGLTGGNGDGRGHRLHPERLPDPGRLLQVDPSEDPGPAGTGGEPGEGGGELLRLRAVGGAQQHHDGYLHGLLDHSLERGFCDVHDPRRGTVVSGSRSSGGGRRG